MKLGHKLLILFLLSAIMVGGNSFAQDKLSLNDCIELALKNRASIIAARGNEQLANAGKRAALGAFLPRVSASYSYGKGKETNIDPANALATDYMTVLDTTIVGNDTAIDASTVATAYDMTDEQDIGPSKTLSISANMSIIDFSNIFSYADAKKSAKAAHLDVIKSEQDLIYSVKVSYYAYLANVENVDVQEEAVKRSEEQLKLIQSRYDLGSASLSDVLKQKVQFGNDQLSLLTAKNSVVTSKASLSYTIGIDPNKDVEYSSEYEERQYGGTLDEAIGFGMEHEPGFLSTQMNVEAAKSGVKSSYMRYLPTLSASASYSKFNGTQAYPISFDYSSNTMRYGFTVSWNIFDGFSREYSVTQSKIRRNNAMAQLADQKNYLTSNIKTAYYAIEQQRQSKEIASANVESAQEDLKITQEKYNLGAATILDLLDAQVSLKEAQVSMIKADFDLNLAVAQLDNAMGKM